VSGDVRSLDDLEKAVALAEQRYGKLNVLGHLGRRLEAHMPIEQ